MPRFANRSRGAETAATVDTGRNVALVRRFYDAFNARDARGVRACTSAEVEFHAVYPARESHYGHEAVSSWLERRGTGIEGPLVTIVEADALDHERVLVSGVLHGGSLQGVATAPFAAVLTVSDGLLVCIRHYLSDPATMGSVGLL